MSDKYICKCLMQTKYAPTFFVSFENLKIGFKIKHEMYQLSKIRQLKNIFMFSVSHF